MRNPSVFDDMVLDSVPEYIDVLSSATSDEFLETAHRFVREMLTLRRPDGSTPDAQLIQEVLRRVLDAVDARLTVENRRGPGPPNRRAWITAWRACAHNFSLLERMLAEVGSPADVSVPPASTVSDNQSTINNADRPASA